MKKLISTFIVVITIFTFTAFAGDSIPSGGCVYGHLNSTGICVPPEGNGNRNAADNSTLTYIETLIAEYNPFVFLLK